MAIGTKIGNNEDWRNIFDAHNNSVDAYDGIIGSTSLPTTAQTLTGAIAEQNQAIANKIKRKKVTVSCSGTWITIPVPSGIDHKQIINVIPSYDQSNWIVWRLRNSSGPAITFLRLTTSSTNIYIKDTEENYDIDIIYTDSIQNITT